MSEDLTSLENGGVPSGLHTTAAEWVYLRQRPYIEITNDPSSESPISSLTIQMHNLTQDLAVIQTNIDPIAGASASVFPSITSPTILPTNADDSVTISFADLDPGSSIIFRLQLVPAGPGDTPFADYRNTMLTISNSSTPDPHNATSTATFDTPSGPLVLDPVPWGNISTAQALQTSFGIAFSCLNTPDTIVTVPNTGGTNIPTPEPSTLALTGLGALGLLFARKKFSRTCL
ncbi:MAG TPA: PEP-CTERM sorting domain-containing protein [Pirellulales bacterium]|jgi:hypothetical protein|nr:PEP-CTERM sorting domain-containing protein [Pirellulales bacterium]